MHSLPTDAVGTAETPAQARAAGLAAAFDVAEVLSEIEARFALRPGAPRLRVRALPALACDRDRFATAVMNLLSNACDAMPNGGAVSAFACIYGEVEGVEICIVDSGVGMSEATLERAFYPGFTTKSVGLGGLGLPMAAAFVFETGGRLLIESVPGVGAIVRLRTPSACG